jgi:hypothetical protein
MWPGGAGSRPGGYPKPHADKGAGGPKACLHASGQQGQPSSPPHPVYYPVPTHLTASIPEGLRVVVAGVHSVGGGVDTGELVLVEAQVLCWLLLQDLVGLSLTEG